MMKLTQSQIDMLVYARKEVDIKQGILRQGNGWFEPIGRWWRTCDSLVKLGLLDHNGAERTKGEKYRFNPKGRVALDVIGK